MTKPKKRGPAIAVVAGEQVSSSCLITCSGGVGASGKGSSSAESSATASGSGATLRASRDSRYEMARCAVSSNSFLMEVRRGVGFSIAAGRAIRIISCGLLRQAKSGARTCCPSNVSKELMGKHASRSRSREFHTHVSLWQPPMRSERVSWQQSKEHWLLSAKIASH
jgi:hypothetical protein